ncbi:MAG: histone deacetylase [Calditrichaeota bacterium]|nr:MAG: histone deacetylase [Calditrichota bacterium]
MIRFWRRPGAHVVFSSEYLLGLSTYGSYHGFDIYKYKRMRDALLKEKILRRKYICAPHPCRNEDIELVHDKEYIRKIQDPVFVQQMLKIQMNSMWDNSVLEYFKAVTGGTLFATALALKKGGAVFNLGGGFHHAHADRGEGFCLINDVAIAIEKFRRKGRIRQVLVIDLDYHQGNGTAGIFRDDTDVFTFSIHAEQWEDIRAVSHRDILIDSDIGDAEYLQLTQNALDNLQDFPADILFYIAGSDPYEKDELADMRISRGAMLQRNRMVYQYARDRKTPLVVVPGGGYGKESWHIYHDFLKAALTGKGGGDV